MPIKDWNEDDRPREKLISQGPESCSVAELIAILITNGSKKKSAVELGREIMQLCNNNLMNFTRLTQATIESVDGIGPAKSTIIRAAQELGRRIASASFDNETKLLTGKAIADNMKFLREYNHEEFWALYCDGGGKLLRRVKIASGDSNSVNVDYKQILQYAFHEGARRILLCHNHPAGSNHPSNQDIDLTNGFIKICKLLNIDMPEHIIIAKDGYYSFRDNDLIN
ncbi:MAG: DNA repair protein RadC [Bacteroidales bacterium]|nr:DNA repair protein RadC [Bacteroidales bacterium]